MKSAPLCLLILFASPAFAQEQCASVIALSKIVSTSTSSEFGRGESRIEFLFRI